MKACLYESKSEVNAKVRQGVITYSVISGFTLLMQNNLQWTPKSLALQADITVN
jgi:hypothetical protein